MDQIWLLEGSIFRLSMGNFSDKAVKKWTRQTYVTVNFGHEKYSDRSK